MAYLKGQLPVIQRRVDPVTGVGLISDNDLLVFSRVAGCTLECPVSFLSASQKCQ